MIDWLNLAANSLWVLGLSLALAVVSHATWTAGLGGERLRKSLDRPAARRGLALAGLLFCAGLASGSALDSASLMETGLWLLLGLAFVAQLIVSWRHPSPE